MRKYAAWCDKWTLSVDTEKTIFVEKSIPKPDHNLYLVMSYLKLFRLISI